MIHARSLTWLATVALLHVAGVAAATDIVPGPPQKRPVAIVGGTIHRVSGAPIKGGTVVFSEGKIVAVGKNAELPENARQIDASGKHVYPALFDAHTQIGLTEINAVRATRDMSETGRINPNVLAWKAVNPDSEIIPVTRSNGVLLTLTAPTGGLLSGQSAVLQLDGWTWEDMTLAAPVAMHINWPRIRPTRNFLQDESSPDEQRREREQALRELEDLFEQAKHYAKARASADYHQPRDARLDAMLPVIAGEILVVVAADDLEQIQSAVSFGVRHGLKLIILGGYDAVEAADLLKAHNIPVIVGGVYRLPERRSDAYDAAYTLPARLQEVAIQYCIAGASRFAASNVRNLPYHAATAAAFGLSPEEALRAITLSPAEILGVAERVGSIEEGKDATLFIADGDILETATQVEQAFIQGRTVDLDDRHKRLYRKYQQRLKRSR